MFATNGQLSLTNNMEGLGVSFTIAERDPSFQIIKLNENGTYTTLANKPLGLDQLYDWLNIVIKDYGNVVTVTLNDTHILTANVSSHSLNGVRDGNKVLYILENILYMMKI